MLMYVLLFQKPGGERIIHQELFTTQSTKGSGGEAQISGGSSESGAGGSSSFTAGGESVSTHWSVSSLSFQ